MEPALIVLHMGFSEQTFFLWGERSFTRNGLHNLRRMRRVSPDCVIDHIWDPGAAGLEGALSEIGFSLRGEPRLCRREVWLPTFAGKYPVPSSPLLGEIPRTHIKRPMEYGMCAWLVDALDVDIPDVLGFVSLLSGVEEMSQDGMLLAHGVMAGLDLCYLAECARFAMSLLERGRFLPDVRRTISSDYDAKYEPVWRPVLMGEDATRFARLARAMPDILRSYGPGRAPRPAQEVLDSMFGRMIDGAVRHSWAKKFRDSSVDSSNRKLACALVGRKSAGGDSQVVGKRAMGRLVNALNPHSLWARALGWLEETDGLSQSLESIFPDVRKWWDRFEWMAKAPFKVCLEVVEPEGEAQSPWRLEYMIHSL
ncbi:MAG: hypothetical protein LBQ56_03330, partial [Synergistaceae bacterium]|nr:hypothetical protein [Synergistaceae bacterium]